MSAAPGLPGCEIQRLVLHDPPGAQVRHVIATFPERSGGRRFLRRVLDKFPITWADATPDPERVDVSLGLCFRGLQRLAVPSTVLGQFLARAPAFASGAPLRAAEQLGDTGPSHATHWDRCFDLRSTHALLSLHAHDDRRFDAVLRRLRRLAAAHEVQLSIVAGGHFAEPPTNEVGHWVHFGFRDGLSRVHVNGCHRFSDSRPASRHEAGEFLLGHANDHGFNPWLLPTAHDDVRAFFRNGSFGVLRRIEQDVVGFDAWVRQMADRLKQEFAAAGRHGEPPNWVDYVKAKVCGRWPDGRRITDGPDWWGPGDHSPEADFDYAHDTEGLGCPFGAHVRRMNPRQRGRRNNGTNGTNGTEGSDMPVHARQRPLVRRGRPYGALWMPGDPRPDEAGLLGLFFCASLEDQFEHLLGQWADRPVLGLPDRGRAKDPLIGQHEDPTLPFDIPQPDRRPTRLDGLRAFARTRGTLYAFFPSRSGLDLLLDNARFFDLPEAPLEP